MPFRQFLANAAQQLLQPPPPQYQFQPPPQQYFPSPPPPQHLLPQVAPQPPAPLRPHYGYDPLASKNSIRLLVLSPGKGNEPICYRLLDVRRSDEPTFEALSYTWGDDKDTCPSYCEGKTLMVTRSLHAALRHLRYGNGERILWADAVCINQGNKDEKAEQVPLMGEIYACSQRVVVWLGEETHTVRKSFEAIEKLHRFFLQHEPGYPTTLGDFRSSLLIRAPLLNSSWL